MKKVLDNLGDEDEARDVFISHASEDAKVANNIVQLLKQNQIRCWIAPRDIEKGLEWAEAIIKGLERTRILILVLSTHSNETKQVKRELRFADDMSMPVLPIRIENIRPTGTMNFFLKSVQWLDAFAFTQEEYQQQLISSVKHMLVQTQKNYVIS